jgi:hypothetical protein
VNQVNLGGDIIWELGALNDQSLLCSDPLGRQLSLLILELADGDQSSASSSELYRGLCSHPGVQVLRERLGPDVSVQGIERSLMKARDGEVDTVLVWAGPRALPTSPVRPGAMSDVSPDLWPSVVIDVAERINLFDHCFIAAAGDMVNHRNARRLGFEDGFESSMALDTLVERLQREAALRDRNPGSSPPCYL